MLIDFAVTRRSGGLVASLDADRFGPDADAGADAAGAADSSQLSGEDAQLDAVDGADESASADRAAAGDDDDEEFDADDDGQQTNAEERVKKLANAIKKAKRKLAATRSERQRLKELRDRGLSLDDLYADAREYRRLSQLLEQNPRLRAALNGGDAEEREPARRESTRRPAPEPDEEFQFDESPDALGFDPKESQANRTLARGLREVASLKHQFTQLLKRLDPDTLIRRVDSLDQGLRQQTHAQVTREWTDAIGSASPHIKDPNQQKVFGDLMRAAFKENGGKRPAKFFVDHYLKLLGVNPAQAARATQAVAAQRNRTAERVAQLPRQNQGANAAPAPARKSKELLADVHKRIRNQVGV